MEEKNNKKLQNILIAVVGLLFIIITLYAFGQITKPAVKKAKNTNEAEKILAENKEAINMTNSAAIRPVRPIDKTDHYLGNLDAPLQLIVYSDFDCPFCAQFYDTIEEIKKNYGGKIAIAFRHFPLLSHPMALPAALAAECAGEQGKFWEMHDKLFILNKSGELNPEKLKEAAAELNLKAVDFNYCFEQDKYKDKIQEQMVEARNFLVIGAPTSFLNGQPLPGAVPFLDYTSSDGRPMQGMKTMIDKLLRSKTED